MESAGLHEEALDRPSIEPDFSHLTDPPGNDT